jgi:phage terminase large subunit-like protein
MSRVPDHWIRNKSDEQAVDDGCTFELAAADRVRFFASTFCRHSKGEWAGQSFEFLPWQWENLVAPLFGWKRPDGSRRFRKAGWWVAKKNGKTSVGSVLSLYMLMGDGEPGAEIYSAASDRDQASIVFREASSMIKQSPDLSKMLEVIPSTKRIIFQRTGSWYKALSADVASKEGLNWHLLLFDELHAQADRKLWDTLSYGGIARRQPLLISISTAGFDRESIGFEQYEYAKNVQEGRVIDTAFLPYVAEVGEEEDWKDPEVWRKANPSLGVTIKLDSMAEDCREAAQSPLKENAFRRYRLNQWTTSDVRWLSMDRWRECGEEPIDVEALAGLDCFAAVDLSSTTDTASLTLLFPLGEVEADDVPPAKDQEERPAAEVVEEPAPLRLYAVLPFIWVPEEACKRRERANRTKFTAWVKRGLMLETPGDVIDYDVIRAKINELKEKYNIVEIAIDRWNATHLSTQLAGDGHEVVGFGQGFASMSAPSKELEALVLSRRLRHGGHPVLMWMAGNVAVEQDAAGNVKPSKKKSREKIDGIVSLIMALGRAMVRPEVSPGDYYLKNGIDLIGERKIVVDERREQGGEGGQSLEDYYRA